MKPNCQLHGFRALRLPSLPLLALAGAAIANSLLAQQPAAAQPVDPAAPTAQAPLVPPPSPFPPPRFETWPEPPPRLPVPQRAMPYVTPPVTDAAALARAAGDKRMFSFRAENMEMKAALALFARANKLNIVPDQDVTGSVTLDVQDLALERIMQALLEAHDLSWSEEGGLIRVRTTQTRSYVVDYLRMTREGTGNSLVTLSSGGLQGGGGSGGGGLGGGGGGLGGGGGGGLGGGGGGGGTQISGSKMELELKNPIKFWTELEEQIKKLLTSDKASLAINTTAGVIQVTDRPSALRRVEEYLGTLAYSVNRQVDIEAKLYDVTLGDQFQLGVDWAKVVAHAGGSFGFLGAPFSSALIASNLSFSPDNPILSPGASFSAQQTAFAALFTNRNLAVVVQALKQQGEVNVISQPRLRTLNNQTAIMKVGTDLPFFLVQSQLFTSGNNPVQTSGDQLSIITVGTVLAITPQISADSLITLDVTPAISSLVSRETSRAGSTAPVLDIKQSSTIVRMRDGETIIMGGLIQNTSTQNRRKTPLLGDIPWFGLLFQAKIDVKQKKELVIFVTPKIVD